MKASRLLKSTFRSKAFPGQQRITTYSQYSMQTMATPYHVHVPTTDTGILDFAQNDPSASKVSELLQKDLENHHVFFNAEGFHNHVVHHLLTLYGTGANPSNLQKAFDDNASYQIRAKSPASPVVQDLQADFAAHAPRYLGKGKHYADFLRFFQAEMDQRGGWRDVLTTYVFREGDATAHDMQARLYAGFLHPMIQLMFGIEWEQPAIVAEALAQAAVHENKLQGLFDAADRRAEERKPARKPLAEFFEDLTLGGHERLVSSAQLADPNKIHDGIMKRAPEEAVEYVSGIKVREDELEERTAEMIHTAAYVATAAAAHPPHISKLDFFLIHHINSAPIFLKINAQPWIPTVIKVRLLEWKMRLDVLQYVARGCPPLDRHLLRTYVPKDKDLVPGPRDLLPRFHVLPDDGHVVKVARALLIAQEESRKYADKAWLRIKADDEWLKAQYLLLDSTEGQAAMWVRSAGFDGAWVDIPKAE